MRFVSAASYALFALLAGGVLPLQAAINVRLRDLVGNPLRASLGSFVVGTLILIAATLVVRGPLPSLATLARAPWWIWSGGAFGVFFILATIVVVPRLGSAVTFALIVAGQMATSVVIDRFGLFGLAQTPLSPTRLIGAVLLVGGVLLVRK